MLKPKPKHLIISLTVMAVVLICLLAICIPLKAYIANDELAPAMLTTSGIFIGFIIAALGIFYAVPLRQEIRVALIKQGYYKQIAQNYLVSIILFFICIVIAITAICISSMPIVNHILNSFLIAIFVGGALLAVLTSINFFKVVMKSG